MLAKGMNPDAPSRALRYDCPSIRKAVKTVGGTVMTIIARGRQQVQKYERALGGEPRHSTVKKTRSEMSRWLADRSKKKSDPRDQIESILIRRQKQILKDFASEKENTKLKRLCEQRAKRKIVRPKPRKIEPCVVTGSNFAFHAPPYDADWTYNPANQGSDANASNGSYDLAVQSIGDGNEEVAAGVMSWFFCADPAPMNGQRFAALLDYSDDWWDSAGGFVAHNDMRTRLWVWGQTENAWVCQADLQPSWSDGVGWFESHGNDPAGDAGTISVETFFPAMANSWYQAWVWGDAQAYGQDGGIFGFGASSIHFSASVPLMVFGSLF
jgi:hypothetical protein